jgi:glycolate oxidase FAD binding subunit
MTTRGALFRSLVDICGMRFARLAGPADTVGGTPASWVAAPPTVDGVAAIVRLAVEHDLAVVARGAATKLDWGARPTRADLLLDTGRLAGVWHHDPAGGFAEIGAGTPLRAAQSALARGGWRLALDGASIGATVGGVIAADEAGPLAHRHARSPTSSPA